MLKDNNGCLEIMTKRPVNILVLGKEGVGKTGKFSPFFNFNIIVLRLIYFFLFFTCVHI